MATQGTVPVPATGRTPEEDAAKSNQETLIANGCKSIYLADYNRPFASYKAAFEQLLPYHLLSDVDPEEADIDEADDEAGISLLMSRDHVWRDHVLRKAHTYVAAVEPIAADMTQRLKDESSTKRKRVYEDYMTERWMRDIRAPFDERTAIEQTKLAAQVHALEQARLVFDGHKVPTSAAAQPASAAQPGISVQHSGAASATPGSTQPQAQPQPPQAQPQQAPQAAHSQQPQPQAQPQTESQPQQPQAQQPPEQQQGDTRGPAQDAATRETAEQMARERAKREQEARERLVLLEQQQQRAAAATVASAQQQQQQPQQSLTAPQQQQQLQDRRARERESLARAGALQDRAWAGWPARQEDSQDRKERERLLRERDAQARVATFQNAERARQQQQQQQPPRQ